MKKKTIKRTTKLTRTKGLTKTYHQWRSEVNT